MAILALNFSTGGEAKPDPYLGTIGTPIRSTYVADPTEAPDDGTPRARPTFAGVQRGTPAERDARRRNDLLLLLGAANALRERTGSYATTNGNVQTLCAFRDDDVGCGLASEFGGQLPEDPFGNPIENGYWYASTGEALRIYAALELDIPDNQKCPTDNVDLLEKANLICVVAP